jgi:hypothetical protein
VWAKCAIPMMEKTILAWTKYDGSHVSSTSGRFSEEINPDVSPRPRILTKVECLDIDSIPSMVQVRNNYYLVFYEEWSIFLKVVDFTSCSLKSKRLNV